MNEQEKFIFIQKPLYEEEKNLNERNWNEQITFISTVHVSLFANHYHSVCMQITIKIKQSFSFNP